MTRLIVSPLLGLVVAASACNSDQPKRSELGADGGVMLASGGSDPTDSPKGPNDGLKDEPPDAGAPDAGALLVDAGGGPVPTLAAADQVDAGHMQDGKAGTSSVIGGGRGDDALKDNLHTTVWNRVLVKAKTKDVPPTELQALVEKATGQKIEKVRKTAGTFWLLQFQATSPPRKQAEQQALIDKLKQTGSFAIVEGDQLMTIK